MQDSQGPLDMHSKKMPFFSHPDYTVGSGITPDQPPEKNAFSPRVADYTAGREFHPAPKNLLLYEQRKDNLSSALFMIYARYYNSA